MTYSVEWLGDRVRMLDQSRLPDEERYDELTDSDDVADAIRTMRVRARPPSGWPPRTARRWRVSRLQPSSRRSGRRTWSGRSMSLRKRVPPP